jgi:hypothetical protein
MTKQLSASNWSYTYSPIKLCCCGEQVSAFVICPLHTPPSKDSYRESTLFALPSVQSFAVEKYLTTEGRGQLVHY